MKGNRNGSPSSVTSISSASTVEYGGEQYRFLVNVAFREPGSYSSTAYDAQVSGTSFFSLEASRWSLIIPIYVKVKEYRISTNISGGGTGTVSGGGTYLEGETVTLKATATGDLTKFFGWNHNGSRVSSSATYSFTANEANSGTWTAVLADGWEYPYPAGVAARVDASCAGAGSVNAGIEWVTTPGAVTKVGFKIEVTSTNPGWKFDHWEFDTIPNTSAGHTGFYFGLENTLNSQRSATVVRCQPTAYDPDGGWNTYGDIVARGTAFFVRTTSTLTVIAEAAGLHSLILPNGALKGSVSPTSDSRTGNPGTTVQFTLRATPANGDYPCRLLKWVDQDGVTVGTTSALTLTKVIGEESETLRYRAIFVSDLILCGAAGAPLHNANGSILCDA